jgi:hypothetical protein
MLKGNFVRKKKETNNKKWAGRVRRRRREERRHNTTWHASQILGDGHRLHNKYKLHFAFTFH